MNYLVFLLFVGTTFSYSSCMTDTHIVPKWLYMLLGVSIIGVVWAFMIIKNKGCGISVCFLYGSVLTVCSSQAIYALAQSVGILPSGSFSRVVGSFDNPAGLAACLCMGIPSCIYFYCKSKKNLIKRVIVGICLLIVMGLLFSGSRAGLIAGLVFPTICLLFRYEVSKWTRGMVLVLMVGLLGVMYYAKKKSADGRMLMYLCAWEMVKERPWTGYGMYGVEAHYMDFQAKWLSEHSDSHFDMLADNVKHVFNEYLEIGIRFGIIGWGALTIAIVLLLLLYKRNPSGEKFCAWMSLGCIGILACFSYPLTYPFTWAVIGLNLYVLLYELQLFSCLRGTVFRNVLVLFLMFASGTLFAKVMQRIYAELEWGKLAKEAYINRNVQMYERYDALMPILGNNPYFLYNYSAGLFVGGFYEKSLQVAQRCRCYWADYDLELLQGEILLKQNCMDKAERHYMLASQMCPVRFMPLYKLYKLYKGTGQKEKQAMVGERILKKAIKINSVIIQKIRREVCRDLNISSKNMK